MTTPSNSLATTLTEKHAKALAALAASRGQMRAVMLPHEHDDPGADAGHEGGFLRRAQVLWRYARQRGHRIPALQIATEALQGWWMSHPWRQIGRAFFSPLNDATAPLVRRHPTAAMVAAAVVGGALISARPWRWTMVRRQGRLLRQQALGWAFALASGPAGQALVASLLAGLAMGGRHGHDKPPADGGSAADSAAPKPSDAVGKASEPDLASTP